MSDNLAFATERPYRVVFADDHPMVMKGFASALEDYNVEVVGTGKTPEEAIDLYFASMPDVVVLDIRFGNSISGLDIADAILSSDPQSRSMSGLDIAEKILAKDPDAKIIFLSQFDQIGIIERAYRIGGMAFMKKSCEPDQLYDAIKTAAEGEQYIMPDIARQLAKRALQPEESPLAALDDRERATLKFMAMGKTNVEIAEILQLSPKTISNTSQTIKEKLKEKSPARLALIAVAHGLLKPEAVIYQ